MSITDIIAIMTSGGGIGTTVSGILEGLGIPWPGAIVITAAGTEFSGIPDAIVLGTLFSITYTIGSVLQYAFGRFCRNLLERFLSPKMRSRLDEVMAKYGQAAVLWTRPLAVGNYISIPAGMMRMHPGKFVLYTFLGIWPWAFGMVAAGGVLSTYVTAVTEWTPYLIATGAAFVLFTGARRLYRFTRERGSAL